jgi:transcriptional regulator with PAS, ATPase and Fis domain
MEHEWEKEIGFAVTICDSVGSIVYMNEKSMATFGKDGGRNLLGKSLFDCHPEPSLSKLKEILENQGTNAYTIEKNGIKKLIYQTPWYEEGKFSGLVEISLPLPEEMPHFVRK